MVYDMSIGWDNVTNLLVIILEWVFFCSLVSKYQVGIAPPLKIGSFPRQAHLAQENLLGILSLLILSLFPNMLFVKLPAFALNDLDSSWIGARRLLEDTTGYGQCGTILQQAATNCCRNQCVTNMSTLVNALEYFQQGFTIDKLKLLNGIENAIKICIINPSYIK